MELKLPGKLTIEADASNLQIDIAKSSSLTITTGEGSLLVESTGANIFLPAADNVDDTGATYFYFGWESVNGSWLVRRQLRVDATTEDATIGNNAGYVNLTAAWPDRGSLAYA